MIDGGSPNDVDLIVEYTDDLSPLEAAQVLRPIFHRAVREACGLPADVTLVKEGAEASEVFAHPGNSIRLFPTSYAADHPTGD